MRKQAQNTQGRRIDIPFPSHSNESLSENQTRGCAICGRACKGKYCTVKCYRTAQRSIPTVDRFWAKVQKTDGCWLWTGSTSGKPGFWYGTLNVTRDSGDYYPEYAHRLSWKLHNGPIPEGASVLHTCDVTRCVNPAHLFLGTQTDNMADASAKGRLHVPRPRRHKLTSEQLAQFAPMRAAGLLLHEIAAHFGVTKGYVSLVLNGKRRQYDAPKPKTEAA